jgi:hypothetical protein
LLQRSDLYQSRGMLAKRIFLMIVPTAEVNSAKS